MGCGASARHLHPLEFGDNLLLLFISPPGAATVALELGWMLRTEYLHLRPLPQKFSLRPTFSAGKCHPCLQPSQGDSSHQERRRLLGLHKQSPRPPTTRDTHIAESSSAPRTLAIHRQPRGLKSTLCTHSLACDHGEAQAMETESRQQM